MNSTSCFRCSSLAGLKRHVIRFGLVLACGLAAPAVTFAAQPAGEEDSEWTIEIRPGVESRAAVSGDVGAPAPQVGQPGAEAPVSAASGIGFVQRMSYVEAYESIPFSRAEYEANPAYRHEAAMELMYGVLRPTTTVKQTVPYFSRYPDFFRYRHTVFPYPFPNQTRNDVNLWWRTSVIAY